MDSVGTKSFIDQKIEEAQAHIVAIDQRLKPFYALLEEKEKVEQFIGALKSVTTPSPSPEPKIEKRTTRGRARLSKKDAIQLDQRLLTDPRFKSPFTVREVMAYLNVSRETARGLIKRLRSRGDILKTSEVSLDGGMPANVYQIKESIIRSHMTEYPKP